MNLNHVLILTLLTSTCVQTGPSIRVDNKTHYLPNSPISDQAIVDATQLVQSKVIDLDYSIPKGLLERTLGSVTVKEAEVKACDATKAGSCLPVFPIVNKSYHFDGNLHYSAGEDASKQAFVFVNNEQGKLVCLSYITNPFPFSGNPRLGSGVFYNERMLQIIASERNWRRRLYGKFSLFSFAADANCRMDQQDKICNCSVTWVQQESAEALPSGSSIDKKASAQSQSATLQFDARDLMLLPVLLTSDESLQRRDFAGSKTETWSNQRLYIYNLQGENPWQCSSHYGNCKKLPQRTQSITMPQQCAYSADWLICTPYPTEPPFHTRPLQKQLFLFSRQQEDSQHFSKVAKVINLPEPAQGAVGIALYKDTLLLAVPNPKNNQAQLRDQSQNCRNWACSDDLGRQRILEYSFK